MFRRKEGTAFMRGRSYHRTETASKETSSLTNIVKGGPLLIEILLELEISFSGKMGVRSNGTRRGAEKAEGT